MGIMAKVLHKGIVGRFVRWKKAEDLEKDYV